MAILAFDHVPKASLSGRFDALPSSFIFFGWLSDKIGRLKIILAGCVIAALTYFPLFHALTHYVNPALEKFQSANVISVQAKDCNFHIFVGPWSKFSDCDKAKDFLTKSGLSFTSTDLPASSTDTVVTKIGSTELKGFTEAQYKKALADLGYVGAADKNAINWPMTLLILWIMLIYVTMVYGPIAAYLVELFPTRIRYTSCRCHTTSATDGSAVCCRCWPRRWSLPRATSTTACGIRSSSR